MGCRMRDKKLRVEGRHKIGRLDNKVAIITGGCSGIGRAMAVLFAGEGARVVVACRNASNGEETVSLIRDAGGEALFIRTDVSQTEDVKRMVGVAVDVYGKLDVLVNNAGAGGEGVPTTESSEDNFARLMDVNVKGVWLGMKYAVPEMIKVGGGSIINISSIAADVAQRGLSLYSASKGAVLSMSRVVAVEFANRHIRVNCIKPGVVLTPLARSVIKDNPEIIERWKAASPMGSLIPPEQIAELALFLASEDSSYITGQELAVDGGAEINSHFHLY